MPKGAKASGGHGAAMGHVKNWIPWFNFKGLRRSDTSSAAVRLLTPLTGMPVLERSSGLELMRPSPSMSVCLLTGGGTAMTTGAAITGGAGANQFLSTD